MNITIFPSVRDTTSGRTMTVHQAFERIKNNTKQSALIKKIRSLTDKSERDILKRELPCYCFSGIFTRKNAASITEHSGLICLDFDGEIRDNIMAKSEYIYACFLSPSGTGYKVLVKIPPSIDEHEEYFDSLKDYFNLPSFDEKVRNISQACYDTEDPDIYINEDAPVFMHKRMPKEKEINNVPVVLRINDDDRKIEIGQKWIDKTETFGKGGRNAYIAKFSMFLNRTGVSVNRAVNYLSKYEQSDFTWDEIDRTVRGIYKRYQQSFGSQTFEDREPVHYAREQIRKKVDLDDIKNHLIDKYHISSSDVNEIIDYANAIAPGLIFWTVTMSKDKPVIKIDSEALKEFYNKHGIFRYWIDSKSWIMVREENYKIREIDADHIKDLINKFFDDLPDKIDSIKKSTILKSIQDQMDESYLKREKLAWLPSKEITWQEDTYDSAHFYYKNKAVKITKKGLELLDYTSELNGCVWEDQIIPRDFVEIDHVEVIKNSEYAKFCKKLAIGKKADDDLDYEDSYNESVLYATIGYILHSYKDPANPKSIILTDEVISDNPEGGIGKGIFIKAISEIKRTVVFDGKNWNWNKSFLFQRVNLSTQVMAFEDVNRSFNFERLFSIVTEGIEVEKKNKDTFYIPYTRSPKVMITSNYAIKGQGGSHDRRRHEIELKQFFSPTYTPRDYFGHNLYDHWGEDQWQLFDNLMMICVCHYLNEGLLKPKSKNMAFKKLIIDVPEEVISWYDGYIVIDQEYQLSAACENLKDSYQDFRKLQNREINKMIGKIAEFKNHTIEKVTKSNGLHFIMRIKS